ncbi:uncharacterized protein YALI1_C18457g [Yarrowia lipolytica]|uniref:Secreted protein n=1 Tax=Yarrowia lipolytica TaxID=4952 RepID=A0A1D8NAY2_YARLL|nr:hypothetical protein YALI1_C18457g [Yarrowia lipolytica]
MFFKFSLLLRFFSQIFHLVFRSPYPQPSPTSRQPRYSEGAITSRSQEEPWRPWFHTRSGVPTVQSSSYGLSAFVAMYGFSIC